MITEPYTVMEPQAVYVMKPTLFAVYYGRNRLKWSEILE